MNTTLAAITAAGVVYNAADFSDPHLDGPTALTVTADGRVYGHLAQWGTCHIGFGQQCVQPPTSAQGYKYFHQGLVDTDAGPMPVGKITLGTGHAPVDGRTDAVMAAAHYDNTGTVVATVRAGEDEHGIWLAGRLVPGLDDAKVDELRRSGVSGDWRGIDNHHELVAALAVNVPGFPVPRTEQLVASGGVAALVAAGIVLRPEDLMPKTPAELRAVIAAAVADDDRKKKRDALAARVKEAADGQLDDRRGKASKKVQDARKARAFDKAMTAAAGTDDMKAAPLRRYWTKGKGLARWSGSPHPYTTLVKNLESGIKTGMTPQQIKGLAANYFHAVFGIWPGERKGENPVGPGSGAPVVAAGKRSGKVKTPSAWKGNPGVGTPTAGLQRAGSKAADSAKPAKHPKAAVPRSKSEWKGGSVAGAAAPFPPKGAKPADGDDEEKRKRKAAVARAMGGPDPKG